VGAKEFCPNSPTLAQNVVVQLLPTVFLQKMVSTCFSANTGCHCLKSNNVGRHFCPEFQGFGLGILGCSGILLKFSGILPGFSTNQSF